MTEAELVSQARGGDADAWGSLIQMHQEAVFRLAYLILGHAGDAEDIAQDTFIRAYRFLNKFDSNRALRPWLLSICANLARNQRRSLGRYWNQLQRAARLNPEQHTNFIIRIHIVAFYCSINRAFLKQKR